MRFPKFNRSSALLCLNTTHGSSGLLILFLGIVALLSLGGCEGTPKDPTEKTSDARPTVSEVPLRIRVVGQVTSPEIIERRWLSGSEQPIEIQSQNVDDFLANASCEADVVLFPSRLLGELISRDWIAKLPKLDNAAQTEADADETRSFPPAWLSQCSYGGITYAVPLGCSVPSLVASESFARPLRSENSDRDPVVSLNAVVDRLPPLAQQIKQQGEHQAAPEVPLESLDRDALVDRFLTIAFAYTQRNKQYGVLLELETMQPRLTEPEFLSAAEGLKRLAAQPEGGLLATIGSHSDAWRWATASDQPNLAIAATNQLNDEAAKVSSGGVLQISEEAAWNCGGGLIAAIAVDCRQSQQSNRFLIWLTESQTSAVLAPLIRGIDSPSPINVEALAWRAQQANARAALNDQLPQELRIPGAQAFRMKLADELLALLKGTKTSEQALADAQSSWEALIAPQRDSIKLHYQQSLGLKDAKRGF